MISHILCVFINSLVLINRAVFTAPPPHGVHMTPCCVHGQVQSGSGLRQRLHLTQLTFPRLTAPCCTATCRPAAELQERHSFTVVERHPVARGRHYTAYNKDILQYGGPKVTRQINKYINNSFKCCIL